MCFACVNSRWAQTWRCVRDTMGLRTLNSFPSHGHRHVPPRSPQQTWHQLTCYKAVVQAISMHTCKSTVIRQSVRNLWTVRWSINLQHIESIQGPWGFVLIASQTSLWVMGFRHAYCHCKITSIGRPIRESCEFRYSCQLLSKRMLLACTHKR